MTTSLGKVYKNILWFVLIHSVYKAWALQDWGKILRLVMEKNVSLVCCFNVSVINCHAEHFSVRCYSPLVMSTVVLVNSTGFDTSPLLSHMGCIPRFISHWVFIFSIRGGWFVVLVVFFLFCIFYHYTDGQACAQKGSPVEQSLVRYVSLLLNSEFNAQL